MLSPLTGRRNVLWHVISIKSRPRFSERRRAPYMVLEHFNRSPLRDHHAKLTFEVQLLAHKEARNWVEVRQWCAGLDWLSAGQRWKRTRRTTVSPPNGPVLLRADPVRKPLMLRQQRTSRTSVRPTWLAKQVDCSGHVHSGTLSHAINFLTWAW